MDDQSEESEWSEVEDANSEFASSASDCDDHEQMALMVKNIVLGLQDKCTREDIDTTGLTKRHIKQAIRAHRFKLAKNANKDVDIGSLVDRLNKRLDSIDKLMAKISSKLNHKTSERPQSREKRKRYKANKKKRQPAHNLPEHMRQMTFIDICNLMSRTLRLMEGGCGYIKCRNFPNDSRDFFNERVNYINKHGMKRFTQAPLVAEEQLERPKSVGGPFSVSITGMVNSPGGIIKAPNCTFVGANADLPAKKKPVAKTAKEIEEEAKAAHWAALVTRVTKQEEEKAKLAKKEAELEEIWSHPEKITNPGKYSDY